MLVTRVPYTFVNLHTRRSTPHTSKVDRQHDMTVSNDLNASDTSMYYRLCILPTQPMSLSYVSHIISSLSFEWFGLACPLRAQTPSHLAFFLIFLDLVFLPVENTTPVNQSLRIISSFYVSRLPDCCKLPSLQLDCLLREFQLATSAILFICDYSPNSINRLIFVMATHHVM